MFSARSNAICSLAFFSQWLFCCSTALCHLCRLLPSFSEIKSCGRNLGNVHNISFIAKIFTSSKVLPSLDITFFNIFRNGLFHFIDCFFHCHTLKLRPATVIWPPPPVFSISCTLMFPRDLALTDMPSSVGTKTNDAYMSLISKGICP